MYTWDGRVRFSEVGEDKCLTLDSIVNYFQDCSTFQSEDLGNGMDAVEALHRAWVLSSWQIVVNEYPRLGEKIVTGTWPYAFNRFMGYRNFIMYGADGRVLAYANSLWTYINTENGRPARVDDEIIRLYQEEPKYDMEYADRKIALPEEMEALAGFPVEVHHLDTNHHVNNGQYVKMAGAYLPQGFEIAQMRAEYKKSALLGNIICPKVYQDETKVIVSLDDEAGNAYTVVEFLKRT
ncbi:MAG: acyl-[Lachnospiraceae bacterium]|nr:acyl-[acyl-carrier-protein] thioesterase [Lachnospiraceae bacterium]